ncbi:thiamine ABC transporter permease [Vibrio albus]|uniref:Thiamine ABC transporter permease n=1 Tax=Vibrio albus TaxID=2200953 RepID=A0A2U3B979_9VIBR|nr:thiamine ABC transporter permease [Vibrio albus]PWI33333.1 thiamine ABC transporter permease [Vibrio albus]
MIQLVYLVTLLICFCPLLPGILGVLLPAASWLPALGYTTPDFSAFEQVIDWPNLSISVALTLFTGLGSTFIALSLSYLILSHHWGTPFWKKLERSLSPMLAMPHVALAISFALLLSPTGWLYRGAEAMGIDTSGSFSVIKDPLGIGLILVLAIKETPFLLIMSIPVLRQINVDRLCAVSESLGYSRAESWRKVIFPLWLPRIRLPLFAVAAYGLSVVDVALILGPTRPATLAVVIWQWFNDPDLLLLPRAAAGALLLLGMTASALFILRSLEWLILRKFRQWQVNGSASLPARGREKKAHPFNLFLLIPMLTIPVLLIWSFAHRWRFPELQPSQYSLRFWQQELPNIVSITGNSLFYAICSSTVALVLVIACLEYRHKYHKGLPVWLITIPLITPQLSLLFGIQVSIFLVPGQYYRLWVIWSHLIFVFPYLYLTLDGAWRSYDIRLDMCSQSLGKTAWQTWWQVKRPQVQPAIVFGLAVGISVSLAQYLPTQILGAGRINTITTEAVALASGQDRRIMAIYGLLQGVLPLLFFSIALVFNQFAFRYRHNKRITHSGRAHDTVCH